MKKCPALAEYVKHTEEIQNQRKNMRTKIEFNKSISSTTKELKHLLKVVKMANTSTRISPAPIVKKLDLSIAEHEEKYKKKDFGKIIAVLVKAQNDERKLLRDLLRNDDKIKNAAIAVQKPSDAEIQLFEL